MNWRFKQNMTNGVLRGIGRKGILLFAFLCVVGVGTAMCQKLSLSFKQATMEQVLNELKKHTSYDVLFNYEEMARVPAVTRDFTDASVEEILNYCLRNTDYGYRD